MTDDSIPTPLPGGIFSTPTRGQHGESVGKMTGTAVCSQQLHPHIICSRCSGEILSSSETVTPPVRMGHIFTRVVAHMTHNRKRRTPPCVSSLVPHRATRFYAPVSQATSTGHADRRPPGHPAADGHDGTSTSVHPGFRSYPDCRGYRSPFFSSRIPFPGRERAPCLPALSTSGSDGVATAAPFPSDPIGQNARSQPL